MSRLSDAKIAVIGLGYVGLPLAVAFSKRFPVLGFDINCNRVQELEVGVDSTLEVSGGEIQLTDALDELLKRDGLNAFVTDAGIFDCGNKQNFLSANLAVGMRDPDTRQVIKALIEKSGW